MAEGLEYVCFRVAAREDFAAKFAAKDLGVGLLLAMYCGEKLNGGRIKGAKKWTKSEWLLRVHVGEKLTRSCAGLWRWEGEDLVVECYDEALEKRMVAKREAQRAKARKRWSVDAAADAMGDAAGDAAGDATACAAGDAAVLLYKGKGKGICKAEREVCGNATVKGGAGGGAARSLSEEKEEEGFGMWLAEFAAQLPWLAEYRVLPREVAEAAREAYEALPAAPMGGMAELMGAYYADKLEEDRYRRRFWRPRGGKFFAELGDVMQHAERWAREVGWSRKRKRKAEVAAAPEEVQGEEPASEEAVEEFRAWLRKEAGGAGTPDGGCESSALSVQGEGGEG